MLDKVKQMLGALLGAVGDGEQVDEVTLSSTYQDAGEKATMLTMGVQIQFKIEQAAEGAPKQEAERGQVH